jgi:hypothetical protein
MYCPLVSTPFEIPTRGSTCDDGSQTGRIIIWQERLVISDRHDFVDLSAIGSPVIRWSQACLCENAQQEVSRKVVPLHANPASYRQITCAAEWKLWFRCFCGNDGGLWGTGRGFNVSYPGFTGGWCFNSGPVYSNTLYFVCSSSCGHHDVGREHSYFAGSWHVRPLACGMI